MKKYLKKSVIFRLENSAISVIVRFGLESEKLYVVEVHYKHERLFKKFEFSFSSDYESFVFENFGFMIIPNHQFIKKGVHLSIIY